MAKWDHDDLRDKSNSTTVMSDAILTGSLVYTPPADYDIGEHIEPLDRFSSSENVPTLSVEKLREAAEKRTYPADASIKEVSTVKYRYSEGKNIDEFRKYVDSTYSAHYASKNEIQALDVFEALGSLFTTSRDLAIKYLWRAGKKGTKEDTKKDLLKVMHYALFMLHALEHEDK